MALKIEAEVKTSSGPCVVAWDNKLFVGAEDGSISSFDANLNQEASWSAHGVQLFALAAGCGMVYSSSNDGGVRVWSAKGEKITELPSSGPDIGSLHVLANELYVGDELGSVVIYENNIEKARYNVLEEVKDLGVNPPYLFTVRDLDVTVTEIKPDESRKRFVTRHTMEGRAPLRVAGAHLLCMDRTGNCLRLHDSSVATMFKKLHEIKVSDMIVTSLSVSEDFAWTGGWDGCIRRWKITMGQLEPAGTLDLGSCVNGLVSPSPDKIYAVLEVGRILSIKAA